MDQLLKTMNEAPEIVKLTAASANRAFVRLLKAEEQLKLWTSEFQVAKSQHEAEIKGLNDVLRRWDPVTQTIRNPETF